MYELTEFEKKLEEILSTLVEKCNKCPGGDCLNCGQKPLNIEEAISAIRDWIDKMGKEYDKRWGKWNESEWEGKSVTEFIINQK